MAVDPVTHIELYPTCDIHLLLQGPDGNPTKYQLEVRDYLVTTKNLSGIIDKTKYDADESIATVSKTGEITPVAVGETICRIRHTDTDSTTVEDPKTFVSEILARIRVHDQMDDIWIGNNRVTLFKREKSYVPLESLGGTATEVGPDQLRFEIPLFGDFGDSTFACFL